MELSGLSLPLFWQKMYEPLFGGILRGEKIVNVKTSLTDLILLSTDKSLLPHVKHTLWVLITHAFPSVERKKVKSIEKH